MLVMAGPFLVTELVTMEVEAGLLDGLAEPEELIRGLLPVVVVWLEVPVVLELVEPEVVVDPLWLD